VTPSPCISTIAVDETKYWDALRRLTALEYLLEHARPEEEPPDMNVCLGLALLLRDVRAQLHPVED
jgi:hypothetical protein